MSLLPKSSLDRRLLKMAMKYASPKEMSDGVLGQLTPEQCAIRVQDLINSKTVLDEVQERRLLLIGMAEQLEWLKERRDWSEKSWPQISRMMKLMSDQIERTNVNINDVSTKLAEAHAAAFVEAVAMGLQAAIKAMMEQGVIEVEPEPEQLPELMSVGVSEAKKYLDTQTEKRIED